MKPMTNSFQKRDLGLGLSLIMVIISALACSITSYAAVSGSKSIYTIKVLSAKLAEIMAGINIAWLFIGLPLICVLSIAFTREQSNRKLAILVWVLIFFFVGIGIISNMSDSFRPVQSIFVNGSSYNLSYYYNASDNGFYDLIECRNVGLVCRQISTVGTSYPEMDKNAHLEIDEAKHELSVIIEGKTVYIYPLE